MPLTDLAAPNNCWPYSIQAFADALAASAAFQSLVERPEISDAADLVFGRRLTHSRSGRTWTKDDLANLRAYGTVQSEDYGKHRTESGFYRPHGVTAVGVYRLAPESSLLDYGIGPQLSDAQDRDWQNIAGTIADEIVTWLRDNGGPWPINNFELSIDAETRVEAAVQQGIWQDCEFLFSWGREQ